MQEIIYLNGRYISKDRAYITINDRGFHFGDGIYEVIRFYKNKPFCIDKHLNRLKRSLKEVRIEFPGISATENICYELIRKNKLKDSYAGIYIQITRGSHPRIHHFPEGVSPTVCINSFPVIPRKEQLVDGIKVITRPDIRWLRCDIKSISLLANTLMIQEAIELGARECILVRNGIITEATHSSVLGVKDGKVITHPDSNYILPGVTKSTVKDICRENSIEFIEKAFTEEEIAGLDELVIAGTGNEIMPVVRVNDELIGDGIPGPLTRFIQKKFFEMTYEKLAGDKWWDW
ncbi:MAG: aminotransferase class IV [Bacteroidales bacterium]|nr:aminotransferase class IV [Bacteroidales bacterium]